MGELDCGRALLPAEGSGFDPQRLRPTRHSGGRFREIWLYRIQLLNKQLINTACNLF